MDVGFIKGIGVLSLAIRFFSQ